MIRRLFYRVVVIMSLIMTVGTIYAQFAGGSGTENDPWQVGRAEDLNQIRNYIGAGHADKYYIQTNDINLGVAPWNQGEGWQPIGSSSAGSFQGHYDGSNYTISNLTINRTTGNYTALFGYTVGATIINVGLKDVEITGVSYVASLVGRQDGDSLIRYCYVTGNITGTNYIGGIVGYMGTATARVFDCYSLAKIECTSTTTTYYVGGIVAYQYAGETGRCFAAGPMYLFGSSSNAGANIGNLRAGNTTSHMYWNADIIFLESGVGNLHNLPGQQTIRMIRENTYGGFDFANVWAIQENESYPFLQWEGEEPQRHSYHPTAFPPLGVTGTGSRHTVTLNWVRPTEDFGNPDGYNVYREQVRINDEMLALTRYEDTGLTEFTQYNYYVTSVYGETESIPSKTISAVPLNFDRGSGTQDDPFIVSNASELNGVRFFLSVHFRQAADIDLEEYLWDVREDDYINDGEGWMPIGDSSNKFLGHYDGAGLVIDNLYINRPNVSYQGLFGYTDQGSVKNLGVVNADISGDLNTGVIVGYSYGTISHCYATGEVLAGSQVGGISGYSRVNVDCCWSSCNVTGKNDRVINVGSLIGYSYGVVSNSYSTGIVNMGRESVGGLIGRTWAGTVTNCYCRGRVIGTDVAGGLVGHNRGATISNCYSTGPVQAAEPGGLVGSNESQVRGSYWDLEASQVQESQGGEGKSTRQMIYPYDTTTTYVDWDFEEIWQDDAFRVVNDGYPVLFHQEVEPPVVLDAPVVKIEIIKVDDEDNTKLSWEAVEDANSYLIYSSLDPYANDWGQPIAIIGETSYVDEINEPKRRYYHVVASTNEPPGD